jgi:hypothetical protein
MKRFSHEAFIGYASEQVRALKSDGPQVATGRRLSLAKSIEVAKAALATGDDFDIEVFKGDADKTTPQTETFFDLKESAPRAAKYDSALASNLDDLLTVAKSLRSPSVLEKRDLGLDDGGFPDDMNDPGYLKGLPKKPSWDFDR